MLGSYNDQTQTYSNGQAMVGGYFLADGTQQTTSISDFFQNMWDDIDNAAGSLADTIASAFGQTAGAASGSAEGAVSGAISGTANTVIKPLILMGGAGMILYIIMNSKKYR